MNPHGQLKDSFAFTLPLLSSLITADLLTYLPVFVLWVSYLLCMCILIFYSRFQPQLHTNIILRFVLLVGHKQF